jgi:hypothetical protein
MVGGKYKGYQLCHVFYVSMPMEMSSTTNGNFVFYVYAGTHAEGKEGMPFCCTILFDGNRNYV